MAVLDDANGSAKPANGLASRPLRPVTAKNRPGLVRRLASNISRLLVWYSIVTVLFRCPSTVDECDASSPRLCQPYFWARNLAQPRLQPYYDAYAAPYVDAARPYYDTVNRTVVTPARHYAVTYGAPRIQQLQTLASTQWDRNVQPQLVAAQAAASEQYAQVLAPHIDRVSTVVSPYVAQAQAGALQAHQDIVLPAYRFVSPYAVQGYTAASRFTTDTAVPTAIWTWHRVAAFLDATVWPRLQVIYVDTVEPQLEKIGQRLGRYSDKGHETKQKTITAPSSFTKPAQATTSAKSQTSSSAASSVSFSSSSSATPTAPPMTTPAKLQQHATVPSPDEPEHDENEERRIARETVAEDLRAWQEKYAKAADEGASEIENKVNEIATRMIRRQARTTGKSLVADLDEAVKAELLQLRRDIQDAVAAYVATKEAKKTETDAETNAETDAETKTETEATEGEVDEVDKVATAHTPEAVDELIMAAVRRAGVEIKQRAKAVRTWRENYSQELEQTVNRAAENHFTILASIRDLALQKIGMKWAWMEGITYKDWAKYHLLKSRFDEWENELEQLIVTHPALEEAQAVAQALEDAAMGTAQAAAQELLRLKQVGGYKVRALDASDDFDSETTKAAAEAAEAAEAEKAKVEAVEVEAAKVAETETVANEKVEEAAEAEAVAEEAEAVAEEADAGPSTEATDAADAADAADTTDADTADAPDTADAEAVEAVEAVEEVETVESLDGSADAAVSEPDETADSEVRVEEALSADASFATDNVPTSVEDVPVAAATPAEEAEVEETVAEPETESEATLDEETASSASERVTNTSSVIAEESTASSSSSPTPASHDEL